MRPVRLMVLRIEEYDLSGHELSAHGKIPCPKLGRSRVQKTEAWSEMLAICEMDESLDGQTD